MCLCVTTTYDCSVTSACSAMADPVGSVGPGCRSGRPLMRRTCPTSPLHQVLLLMHCSHTLCSSLSLQISCRHLSAIFCQPHCEMIHRHSVTARATAIFGSVLHSLSNQIVLYDLHRSNLLPSKLAQVMKRWWSMSATQPCDRKTTFTC